MLLIKKAIELSNAILEAIADLDWDKVANLDKKRVQLIRRYFEDQANIDEKLAYELKTLNEDIVRRLTQMRQQTQMQQVKIRQGSRVSNAYKNNAPK